MPARNPSLAEVLNAYKASTEAGLRVALPARVESYDASTQLASCKPLIRDTFEEEDGTTSQLQLPVVSNVPVVFPGAGGFRITFPISVGDTVLLVFADRSLDAWLSGGGETSPIDLRRHNLSDAIAIPGLHPNNAPWTGASGSDATIGKDGGPQIFFGLADIRLGNAAATEPVIKGLQYLTAENAMLTALLTYLGVLQVALSATSTALGTILPGSFSDSGTLAGTAVTALNAVTPAYGVVGAALTGFVTGQSGRLSNTVKTI